MNCFSYVSSVIASIALVGCSKPVTQHKLTQSSECAANQYTELLDRQNSKQKEFIKFVSNAMAIAAPKHSEAKNAYLGSQIVRIGMDSFESRDERETWVAILANESRFNPKAKSPVGAIGIGQIMPKSAKWYAEKCGLPSDFSDEDLYLTEINLTISACAFKEMLKNVNGSKTLALISYNAGQFSKDLKRVEQMTNINTETANYVTKISRFLEKVKDAKTLKLDASSSDK
jgi:soluble lytic murein transglycosylase-like protein